MTTEIKILHVTKKLSKEGKPYEVVHVLIKLGDTEHVRKFYLFK